MHNTYTHTLRVRSFTCTLSSPWRVRVRAILLFCWCVVCPATHWWLVDDLVCIRYNCCHDNWCSTYWYVYYPNHCSNPQILAGYLPTLSYHWRPTSHQPAHQVHSYPQIFSDTPNSTSPHARGVPNVFPKTDSSVKWSAEVVSGSVGQCQLTETHVWWAAHENIISHRSFHNLHIDTRCLVSFKWGYKMDGWTLVTHEMYMCLWSL